MTDTVLDDRAAAVNTATADSIGEWRLVAGNRFVPVHCSAEGPFSGVLRWRNIEGATISEITATAHQVHRAPSLIAEDDIKHVKLSLQLEGTGIVSQDGREAVLRPGDLALYETSRPYSLDFPEDLRCLVMAFPQEHLDVPVHLVHRMTAVRMPGDDGVGQVIAPYMQHLAENLDQLSGVTGARLLRSTYDLLTTFVYAQLSEGQNGWGDSRRDEMRSFKLYIDDHLHEPDLSATTVAKAHYISVRYLQYLFREEGLTVSGYIRSRRLERCRLDLADPAQASLSVLQIAQRWGFPDASHFSKVFKAEFGVAPRAYRTTRLSA